MPSEAVYLTTTTVTRSGKKYTYWTLQWRDRNKKNHFKSIGSTKKFSKRQAEKLRREKEYELTAKPGRRDAGKAPMLQEYLEKYMIVRKSELTKATLDLHGLTGRYLTAFFGPGKRIDRIQRADARVFKAALAEGRLLSESKKGKLSESTVHLHMRNARKIFGIALEDDFIIANPFDKMAGKAPPPKGFHEVTDKEFQTLYENANPIWKLWLALCLYAGLRRGEALHIRWENIDWDRSRLTIIAGEDWRPKDRDFRVVPIVPELRAILLEAFEQAKEGQEFVIETGTMDPRSSYKAFHRLCSRAGIKPWSKPFHTLRKTCLTRWAREFPQHVVSEWAGHSEITTTSQFYLQISEAEYDRAAGLPKKGCLKAGGKQK